MAVCDSLFISHIYNYSRILAECVEYIYIKQLNFGVIYMRKIVDDVRLIFKCCSLYYQDGLGQQEICEKIGISRPTVSRMLQLGRQCGIVKIELYNPENLTFGNMERELEKKYGMNEVIIVPSVKVEINNKQVNTEIGRATLNLLKRILRDGDYIGIAMGRSLLEVVGTEFILDRDVDCTFVPLLGGIGESNVELHSNYLTQEFANKFGGNYVQLSSPAVFSDPEVMRGFSKEKFIQRIYKMYRKLDVAIMGIGIPNTDNSTILNTGYIKSDILEDFAARGCVGDIALRYFDISGKTAKFEDFNSRVLGISLADLHNVERRVGISFGEAKTDAVLGAINGDFINILVTDYDCAKGLLDKE